MTDEREKTLGQEFARLKERDARAAPPFESMMQTPAPRRTLSPVVFILPLTVTFAAAAAFMLWIATQHSPQPQLAVSATIAAPAPTVTAEPLAFLLDEDFDAIPLEGK